MKNIKILFRDLMFITGIIFGFALLTTSNYTYNTMYTFHVGILYTSGIIFVISGVIYLALTIIESCKHNNEKNN